MPALSPIWRLTIGLILLTVSLLLVGDLLGLTPDQKRAELRSRKVIAETLAVQLSSDIHAGRMDEVKSMMVALQQRNESVLSVGLRTADGRLMAVAGNHNALWLPNESNKSTASQVQVPIHDRAKLWGSLEVNFTDLSRSIYSLLRGGSLAAVVLFVTFGGFLVYSLFPKRALKELDPSAVAPDQVCSALNTLAEGLVIIDQHERIVQVNAAFERKLGQPAKMLIGSKLSSLAWRLENQKTRDSLPRLPWEPLLQGGTAVAGASLKLRTELHQVITFAVNVAPIIGEKDRLRGAIVTFDDVTELERKNLHLEDAMGRLQQSQREITRQNRELQVLATRDSLTGTLNRRSLFEGLAVLMNEALNGGTELCCIMADIDHFKSINDRFGHAVGDKVIKLVAGILGDTARAEDLIGRYGGEEFCVILPGANLSQAAEIAERMRKTIHEGKGAHFTSAMRVSASFGVSSISSGATEPSALVDLADKALYVAKESGRNRVEVWSGQAVEQESTADGQNKQETAAVVDRSQQHSDMETIALNKQIDELKAYIREQNRRASAGVDEATGLPSRVVLLDRMGQSIARCERLGLQFAVLSICIDTVELVDTALGNGSAEKVVKLAVNKIRKVLRSTDTISAKVAEEMGFTLTRTGSGHFVVLLTDMRSAEYTTWILQRMFSVLKEPVRLEGNDLLLDASVGVSLFPGDGTDPDTLLAHSGTALREARTLPGRSISVFYSKEIHRRSREQIRMEAELHRALERDELFLNYQPCVDLQTGRIVALEALLRWRHPEWGLVPPMVFVPIAEHTGLINDIGDWVLATASRQLKLWQDSGYADLSVSVNFSVVQFRQADVAQRILRTVEAEGLSPKSLIVEITESALIQNMETAVATVEQLGGAGFRIALDDFGTGYSSLSYLKRFSIDVVKIDRSFLTDFPTHAHDTEIVSAIIAMAHGLGLRVIAEGVEDERQLETLQSLSCDEIQGYLFSQPISGERVSRLLASPTDIRRVVRAAGKFALDRQQGAGSATTGILNQPPVRGVAGLSNRS